MVAAPLRYTLIAILTLAALLASQLTSRTNAPDPRQVAQQPRLPPSSEDTFTVEMTAYTSEVAQTDSTPRITASGAPVAPGIAAASRDLLAHFPYGTHIEVLAVSGEGCGGWVPETPLVVADTMHPRIENHLDVWLETHDLALAWGRCQAEVRRVNP